jgi:hypothetical protein
MVNGRDIHLENNRNTQSNFEVRGVVNTTRRRWLSVSGFVYVAAWLVGLLLDPSSLGATASVDDITRYYLTHRGTAMIQSYLFDGVAGASLIVLAATMKSVYQRFEGGIAALSNVVFGAAVAAASVSFVQAAFGEVLVNIVGLKDPVVIQTVFDLVNESDTFKMLALGLFIGAASSLAFRTRNLLRWLGWGGAILAPALIVSGLSFVLNSSALYGALYVVLPVLLLWVLGISVDLWRRFD